ncbi:MAG: 30S ribosomal protein S6 [Syntrophobacteraceae bacterium]|jgi:small subunit ribosomal protein S6|nr:30S ribosomal protein S6 [Syntrophobacteraceae bacterium]
MRKYETFFIVDPDLTDEVNSVIDEKLKNVISNNGGSVLEYTPWGKKKLAYPVQKRTRGHYVLMEYAGGPELVAELERNMRLDERILKFITVKLDDKYDPEKEAARKAAAASPPVVEAEEGKVAAVPEESEAGEESGQEDAMEGGNEEA